METRGEIIDGWIYFAHPERNVACCSGGEYVKRRSGTPVYREAGVTIDEGDGALPPDGAEGEGCIVVLRD